MSRKMPALHQGTYSLAQSGIRGMQWVWRVVRYLAPIRPGWTAMPDGGSLFATPGDWIVDNAYMGLYERDVAAMLRLLLRPGDVFLEVGAHRGVLTRVACSAVSQAGLVIAMEPAPKNFQILGEMADRVACRLDVIPAAAWYVSGTVHLQGSLHPGNSGLGTVVDSQDGCEAIAVSAIRIDDLWASMGRPRIAGMKVDVEGAEAAVFAGSERLLRRSPPDFLIVEHNPSLGDSQWWEQVRRIMPNYAVFVLFEHGAIRRRPALMPWSPSFVPASGYANLVVVSPETLSRLLRFIRFVYPEPVTQ